MSSIHSFRRLRYACLYLWRRHPRQQRNSFKAQSWSRIALRFRKWLSLCQHYTHATVFRCFSLTREPLPTATNSIRRAQDLPDLGFTTCPWRKEKGRDILPVGDTSGSDVGVSTCKMAAHHRQNTAGRRKVQVWESRSSTSWTWPAAPGPPAASRSLGPRSSRVAAWGEWDRARPAARGGAAALTA